MAAPPGFANLCERDEAICGGRTKVDQLALAPSAALLTTSSLGGASHLQAAPRFQAEPARDDAPDAAPLIQVTELTAYRPTIDATFVPAGSERPFEAAPFAVQTADAPPAPAARPALLTKAQMRMVNTLNQAVNRDVHKANDFDLYGLLEYWTLPRVIDGKMYGDCEDYALEKRRRLIAAGVPAEALSMAVAVTPRGESHAVLVVSFESGDWVLDNLTPWATPWNEVNYRWVERQVPGSAEWKTII